MLEINLPKALVELMAALKAYEQALFGNDIDALNDHFWFSPRSVRYGVQELLYSHDAIAGFRGDCGPIDQRRTRRNTTITTFGRDFGTTNAEDVPLGSERVGRQSQNCVRTERGWKIVSAHVSLSCRLTVIRPSAFLSGSPALLTRAHASRGT